MLLVDLGAVWEARMRCPLPLAGIAIRRDLAPRWARAVNDALYASVAFAIAHPDASDSYVTAHAQAMDADVVARHIGLYVNDYSLALDESAVRAFLAWGEAEGVFPGVREDLPIFA
jgi:1,4-dihydroxy-6-naphthoate synthase